MVHELLAHVYTKASPQLAKSRHSAWDVFNHRVRFSAGSGTLGQFLSRLCNVWGIQSLPLVAIDIQNALEPRTDAVLRYIHTEHIVPCMEAIRIAQQWREQRNASRENAGSADGAEPDPALRGREDGEHADAAPDATVLPF